jgi:hypothetical protein
MANPPVPVSRVPSPIDQRMKTLAAQRAAHEATVVRSPPPPPEFTAVQLREFYLARERALRNGDKSWT